MATWTISARWLFPVTTPPLEEGVVTIADDRIVAVSPHADRSADIDAGNAALLPGFVNAHVHLDLSDLGGKIPPRADFTDWLRGVIRHRRNAGTEDTLLAIRSGLAECLRHGTTLLGDISSQGTSWPILAEANIWSTVFLEVLGLPESRAAEARSAARLWLTTHPATAACRPGLSPHASYSVRAALFEQLNQLACEFGLPLMTHLAETPAELELLATRTGPFVSFLKDLGVWDENGLAQDPTTVWKVCSAGDVRTLLVHANYLKVTELPTHVSIVYCPRTHAAFGHKPHPFREFLTRGMRVALGTDGLSSNPDLDVLAEARYLHRVYPDVPGAVLLRMMTLSGAEALGWEAETGSLQPGKSADLVVLPLPNREAKDPHELIFASALPVSRVLWRGQWRE